MAKKKSVNAGKRKKKTVKSAPKKAVPEKKVKNKVKKADIERHITPIVKRDPHPRRQTPKVLRKCRADVAFVLNDGRKLRSLIHLIDELENMPDDVFSHHVNEFKNDFSNWIKGVFKDDVLADDLQLVNDRLEAQRVLLKHVVRSLLEVRR